MGENWSLPCTISCISSQWSSQHSYMRALASKMRLGVLCITEAPLREIFLLQLFKVFSFYCHTLAQSPNPLQKSWLIGLLGYLCQALENSRSEGWPGLETSFCKAFFSDVGIGKSQREQSPASRQGVSFDVLICKIHLHQMQLVSRCFIVNKHTVPHSSSWFSLLVKVPHLRKHWVPLELSGKHLSGFARFLQHNTFLVEENHVENFLWRAASTRNLRKVPAYRCPCFVLRLPQRFIHVYPWLIACYNSSRCVGSQYL